MRPIRCFCGILALIMMLAMPAFSAAVDTQPEEIITMTSGSQGLDATVAYMSSVENTENMTTAFVYETKTGTLMFAKSPDLRIYPSSMVKILTALIAIENGDIETVVTVREDVLSTVPYDAVSADLTAGEEMTLGDLIGCMLVGSANDAAAVIADAVCGSQDAFVTKMNDFAQSVGCTDTVFTNVHGLHDEQQYTTVRDIARILDAALDNEQFVAYYSAVELEVAATNMTKTRYLTTGNYLAISEKYYYDPRVTGGRTGVAADGTRCLAISATNDDLDLICILAGAESTFEDNGNTLVYGGYLEAKALLNATFDQYKHVQVVHKDQTIRQVNVNGGNSDLVLGAKDSCAAILPENVSVDNLEYRYSNLPNSLQAPVEQGTAMGNAEIWCGNLCVAKTDLYAMNSVHAAGALQMEDNHASGNGWLIAGAIIICLFVVPAIALVLARWYNRFKHKKASANMERRRRVDRRRRR